MCQAEALRGGLGSVSDMWSLAWPQKGSWRLSLKGLCYSFPVSSPPGCITISSTSLGLAHKQYSNSVPKEGQFALCTWGVSRPLVPTLWLRPCHLPPGCLWSEKEARVHFGGSKEGKAGETAPLQLQGMPGVRALGHMDRQGLPMEGWA